MKTINLEEIAKYADQYIALSQDRTQILAGAKTIKELDKKLRKMKVKKTSIEYIPPLDVALSRHTFTG